MRFKLLVYYKLLRYFWYTARFNFSYFPLKTAIVFPVVFYCRPRLISLKGTLEIKQKPSFRMIGLGYPGNSMKSTKGEVFWDNRGGHVIFHGKLGANPDFSLRLFENATLEFGTAISFGQNTLICCKEHISFGNDVLSSWDNQFFDTDFHSFYDVAAANVIRTSQPIIIGDKVFLGSRTTVLKGTIVPYRSVVASNSLLNKDYGKETCSLIGGNPAVTQVKKITLIISEPVSPSELDELKSL